MLSIKAEGFRASSLPGAGAAACSSARALQRSMGSGPRRHVQQRSTIRWREHKRLRKTCVSCFIVRKRSPLAQLSRHCSLHKCDPACAAARIATSADERYPSNSVGRTSCIHRRGANHTTQCWRRNAKNRPGHAAVHAMRAPSVGFLLSADTDLALALSADHRQSATHAHNVTFPT